MELKNFESFFEYREYENENIQYLIYFFDVDGCESIHEFLCQSEFYYALNKFSLIRTERLLRIVSNPEIFKKYYQQFSSFKDQIIKKLQEFTGVYICEIKIEPNLKNFQISANRYIPVSTPWEEINSDQDIMLEQFRSAAESIDYQNIGNTCRTIMQKISNIVFDPQKHIAPDKVDISEGKFKNRLHTYIKTELGGHINDKIRDYSLSVIDTAEKAINLANTLTHSLNADSFIAESCVVSTISVINILRIIEKKVNAL